MNYLALLVAVIAHMGIGMIWYGPLFGKQWMKEMGLTEKELKKQMKKRAAKAWLAQNIGAFVSAYVMAFFLGYLQVHSVLLAMQIVFWLWLGFTAAVSVGEMFWEHKSLKLWSMNAGYRLTYLLVMAAIIGRWG